MSKKDLLNEELKRHIQLLEYTFYMEEPKDKKDDEDGELLLDVGLYEQDPVGDEEIEDTEEVEIEEPSGEEETEIEDTEDIDPFDSEEGMEIEDEFASDETVEVDVSDIVDKAEETRNEINDMTAKMDELLGKFNDLEGQVTGMDQVIDKIENLETQIEKNNPTQIERLEMRSMDSYPYSVTLTDFWKEQEGYDAASEKEEEYVITQGDVDDYSEVDIRKSFDYDSTDEDY